MSNYIAAVTAIQGTLFVQYFTPTNKQGTLFTIYPPGTSDSNTMQYNAQTINLPSSANSTLLRFPLSSASLSFTATKSQLQTGVPYHFDLFLALNTQQMPPVLLQISNESPIGGAQPPSNFSWSASDQTALYNITNDTRRVWLAAGASLDINSIKEPEGTAQHQLLTSSTWNKIESYDVSQTNPTITGIGTIVYLNNLENPKIVRLLQSNYDVAIVGSCEASTISPTTCITLIDTENTQPSVFYLTNMPYDPTSCIASGNGLIIMATSNEIWTNQYTNQNHTWLMRQPPSFQPNLPSSILDCAVVNSKLYVVLRGEQDPQTPMIASVDLRSSNWDWQRIQLTQTSGNGSNNGSNNGPNISQPGSSDRDGSGSTSKGISGGAIAAIIVVAIALSLFGIGFFLWRRRNTKKSGGLSRQIEKPETSREPSQGSFPKYDQSMLAAQQPLSTQNYTNSAAYHPGYTQHENSRQQSHPQVSGSWSSNSAMAYQTNQPGVFAPIVATSTSTNPATQYVYSSAVSTNSGIAGDKQELSSEEQTIRPESATSNPFLSPRLPNAAFPSTPNTGESISPSDYRTQEMLSPGLANAQLILKRTQTPP